MLDAFARQLRIERQYITSRFALAALQFRAAREATILPAGLFPRDLSDTLSDLESVYVVRLFSEFEGTIRAIARRLWPNPKSTRRTARTLMNRLAARHHVVADVLDDAHEVRRFRNAIVHRSSWPGALPLAECRGKLATFLSYIPRAMLP